MTKLQGNLTIIALVLVVIALNAIALRLGMIDHRIQDLIQIERMK